MTKPRVVRLFALLLGAALLFSGCGGDGQGFWASLEAHFFPEAAQAQPGSYEDVFGQADSGQSTSEAEDAFSLLLDDHTRVSLYRNISYRDGEAFGDQSGLLDVCVPLGLEDGEKRPVVVIVHGGAWNGGDKAEVEHYMLTLANLGYIAVAINYRLLPENGLAQQVEDVLDAVQHLVSSAGSQFPVDMDEIYLMGMSAGAHLALLAAYSQGEGFVEETKRSSYIYTIQGVISLAAPVDLSGLEAEFALRFGEENALAEVVNFLGGDPAENPALLEAASPLTYIDEDTPPTLVLHGTADDTVSPEDGRELYAALQVAGVESELHLMQGMGHGLDAAAALEICYEYLKIRTGVGSYGE